MIDTTTLVSRQAPNEKAFLIAIAKLLLTVRSESILNKIEKYINKTYADEKVCIRGSKYILYEILDWRA